MKSWKEEALERDMAFAEKRLAECEELLMDMNSCGVIRLREVQRNREHYLRQLKNCKQKLEKIRNGT